MIPDMFQTAESPEDRRAARLFLIAITLYFAAQIVLRVTLGGALETDEAEMMLMTPGLRWGYGPQLPLYNWLQIGLFALFGKTLFALSLLKNALLWGTYALLFTGLRAAVPARTATLATLSLFLIPDIAWEAERATTHSNMLLFAISATICAFLWALRTGALRHWALLGVALGIGGIAKYNYWAVPAGLLLALLTMPDLRRRLLTARALPALVIAAAIVAGPYAWMAANRDLALSSVGKIALENSARAWLPEGVPLYLKGLATLIVLPALVTGALWLATRRGTAPARVSPLSTLFLRMGGLLALGGLAAVWLSEAGHIASRWLLPIVIPLVIGIFLRLAPRLGRGALRGYLAILGVVAALVFAGLTYDRYKDGARRDVEFAPLVSVIEDMHLPEDTVIVADFYVGGNLARLRPDWPVRSDLPASAREVETRNLLLLTREKNAEVLRRVTARVDWRHAQGAAFGEPTDFSLPSRHGARPLNILLQHARAE
ncbi:Dolichyl-phosphate-mannose-protein mannosyltransferase [Celeribacter indicus]|nr:Dolichyl-phosphate-mannose-protein mannosyltransferase [Celeribacter indicus]